MHGHCVILHGIDSCLHRIEVNAHNTGEDPHSTVGA